MYVDRVIDAAVQDIKNELPYLIRAELAKKNVQLQVDEASYRALQQKIEDLLSGFRSFR